MRRIIHLSDLHFGRARPELVGPLVAAVNETAPDLVVISGDLTQRARNSQFSQARAFIDRLEPRCLVVPGNHDVPLDNVPARLLRPWRRYKRWISRDLEPSFQDDAVSVIGVNTVNPFSWQRGRIAGHAVRRTCAAFKNGPDGRIHVLVVHHPLEHMPQDDKALMRGAGKAIEALADCGADIILSGHLHAWRAGPFARREARHGPIQVQAGTGLSTRLRGEENDFNLLTLAPGEVTVERFVAAQDGERFVPDRSIRFRMGARGWAAHGSKTL